MTVATYRCEAVRCGRDLRIRVTGRFGAPRLASALEESPGWAQERCDPRPATSGCLRICKLVSRVAGQIDVLRRFPALLSRETDSWHGGTADQSSSHQWCQRS